MAWLLLLLLLSWHHLLMHSLLCKSVCLELRHLLLCHLLVIEITLRCKRILPLLYHLRCHHCPIHRWVDHSLGHSGRLGHRRNIGARVSHSLSWSDIPHYRSSMHHRSSMRHLRRAMGAMTLLATSGSHRMAHRSRMAMLHARGYSHGTSCTLCGAGHCHGHTLIHNMRRRCMRSEVSNDWRRVRSL